MNNDSITRYHAVIAVFSICLLQFIDAVGTGLVYPVLPTLFLDAQYGLVNIGNLHYRYFLYGLSFAFFPMASLFGMPMLGSISDRYGRKNTLIYGLLIIAFGYLVGMVGVIFHMVIPFLICRLLTGFGSGTFAIGNAVLIDISKTDNEKIKNIKYATISSILGFILGPSFSLFMPKSGGGAFLAMPFIITFLLSILNLCLLSYLFPRYTTVVKDVGLKKLKIVGKIVSDFGFILTKFEHKAFAYFFFQLSFGVYLQSLPMLLSTQFLFGARQIGSFFILLGVALAFGMFVIHKQICKFLSLSLQIEYTLLIMAGLLFILSISTLHFASINSIWIVIVISIIYYLVLPLITINTMSYFSSQTESSEQGKLMGGIGVLTSLAFAISAVIVSLMSSAHEVIILLLAVLFVLFSNKLFKVK